MPPNSDLDGQLNADLSENESENWGGMDGTAAHGNGRNKNGISRQLQEGQDERRVKEWDQVCDMDCAPLKTVEKKEGEDENIYGEEIWLLCVCFFVWCCLRRYRNIFKVFFTFWFSSLQIWVVHSSVQVLISSQYALLNFHL